MAWTKVKSASTTITIESSTPTLPSVKSFSIATDKSQYNVGESMNVTVTIGLSQGKYPLPMRFDLVLGGKTIDQSDEFQQDGGTTKSYKITATVPTLSAGTYTLTANLYVYVS